MSENAGLPKHRPRVFIGYRRKDSSGYALFLCDILRRRYGADHVFMDIGSIEPGEDFDAVVDDMLKRTDVFLCLIGSRWLSITGRDGTRRLDNPEDYVRREIERAIANGARTIPLLVEDARMPDFADLPESIKEFAKRDAHRLSDSSWEYDVSTLTVVLDKIGTASARKKLPSSLTGQEIVDKGGSDEAPTRVGRLGGLKGQRFCEDVSTGNWRTQPYQVAYEGELKPNWFTIADFLDAVGQRG